MNDPSKKFINPLVYISITTLVVAVLLAIFPIFGEWTKLILILLLIISFSGFTILAIGVSTVTVAVFVYIIWETIQKHFNPSRKRLKKLFATKTIRKLGVADAMIGKNARNEKLTIDYDYFTIADLSFLPAEIQWFGRYKKSNFVRMDVRVNDEWYIINSRLSDSTLDEFLKRIPEKLKRSRYINRPDVRTYTGKKAHITTQDLQGIFKKQEEVELHITPLWMVVLHNGGVIQQNFIDDISDIRATKHPTDLDADMKLLTFEVAEQAFAYALKDKNFVTHLSDASKKGIDSEATRKKKQKETL